MEDIKSNAANLSGKAVQTRAELRMRSAGLRPISDVRQSPPPYRYLYVNILVVGTAFTVLLEFEREAVWVVGPRESSEGSVTTWSSFRTGTHGNTSGVILEALDSVLDEFLNAYLKANQEDK